MSDRLGPTGNTNPECKWCGYAHSQIWGCDESLLKDEIKRLRAENERLKEFAHEVRKIRDIANLGLSTEFKILVAIGKAIDTLDSKLEAGDE